MDSQTDVNNSPHVAGRVGLEQFGKFTQVSALS